MLNASYLIFSSSYINIEEIKIILDFLCTIICKKSIYEQFMRPLNKLYIFTTVFERPIKLKYPGA